MAEPNASLPPLATPRSLVAEVLEVLRERILSGAFEPGERLVEAELARQLNISRGPIREALAELRAEGLAYDEPRRGSFVATLTSVDVWEIYELRAALEGRAARMIVERGDAAALDALEPFMVELREATALDDRVAFARADAALHAELCRLSGNGRLYRAFVQHVGLLTTLLRMEVTTQYDQLDGILEEHEQLYAELRSGDPLRAQAACEQHLRQALGAVNRMRADRDAQQQASS